MSSGFDGRGRRPGREHEPRSHVRQQTQQELEREELQDREATHLREALEKQVAELKNRKEAAYFLHHLRNPSQKASPAAVRAAEDAVRRRFGPCEALLKMAARDELPAWEQHPPASPAELLELGRSATLADVLVLGLDFAAPGPVLSRFLDACDPATAREALAELEKEGRLDELDERTQGAARKKAAAPEARSISNRSPSDPYHALVERAALTDSEVAVEKALSEPDYDPDLREAHLQEFATLRGKAQAAGGMRPLPSELVSMRPNELVLRLSLVEPRIKHYPPADVVRGFESLRLARESRGIDSVLEALGVNELGQGWTLWFRTGHATPGRILSLGALQLGQFLGWPSRLDQMTEAVRAERGRTARWGGGEAVESRPLAEEADTHAAGHVAPAHPGGGNGQTLAPATAIAPPQPGIHRPGFIDADDGANIRTGPAELGGTPLTTQPLPATTRVFASGQHKEAPEWWYVSAFLPSAIVRGYVQHFRINTDLPEPSAKLHQIKSGDTVERIAVEEFAAAVEDGHDLRYYENVLLAVNRDKNRAGIRGAFQAPNLWGGGANNIQLEAGRRIWLVSPAYAKALGGLLPAGSLTGGLHAKASRVLGHLEDIVQSVTDSPRHVGAVAGEYAETIKEHLPEIIGITAGFILAESASAFLAATPTGVGQLAAVIIQLGLATFGAKAALDAGVQALEHGERWLLLAWTAKGDPRKLEEASQEFLKMLVSVAMAALAVAGMKGNLGKGLEIADAIKIQPPQLGWSPAMVTPEGVVLGGGPAFTPGSIASTGPVVIEPGMMTGAGYLGNMMASVKGARGGARPPVPGLRNAEYGPPKGGGGQSEARAYAKRVTGRDDSVYVDGVEFDGYDRARNVLLDAKHSKGKGSWYDISGADDFTRDWKIRGIVEQARRQIRVFKASGAARIEWHVSEKTTAAQLRALLFREKIDIAVIFRPE
jgi:hypothetical protein